MPAALKGYTHYHVLLKKPILGPFPTVYVTIFIFPSWGSCPLWVLP